MVIQSKMQGILWRLKEVEITTDRSPQR